MNTNYHIPNNSLTTTQTTPTTNTLNKTLASIPYTVLSSAVIAKGTLDSGSIVQVERQHIQLDSDRTLDALRQQTIFRVKFSSKHSILILDNAFGSLKEAKDKFFDLFLAKV